MIFAKFLFFTKLTFTLLFTTFY